MNLRFNLQIIAFCFYSILLLTGYTFKTVNLIEENSMKCKKKSYTYINPSNVEESCTLNFRKSTYKCSDDSLSAAFEYLISVCKFNKKSLEDFSNKFGLTGNFEIAMQDHGKSEIFFEGGAAFWEENLKPSRIKIKEKTYLFYSWHHALSMGNVPGEIFYPDKRWLILKNTSTK